MERKLGKKHAEQFIWHWSVSVLTHADTFYRKNGNQFVLRAEFMIYWWIVASEFFSIGRQHAATFDDCEEHLDSIESFIRARLRKSRKDDMYTLFLRHVRRNM